MTQLHTHNTQQWSAVPAASIEVFVRLDVLRCEDMYRFPVFSIHLVHVLLSFVFNTCVRGDVWTLRLVSTHVSVL